MAQTAESKAKAAHEITKSQGGVYAGSPWKADYPKDPKPAKK
jgi:hypothetical protein